MSTTRPHRSSSLTDDFLTWSPDFGAADDAEDIHLPSILHPVVKGTTTEPLLPPSAWHNRDEHSDDCSDDYNDNRYATTGSRLVDRAGTLSDPVRFRFLAQLVGDGLHTRQFAIHLKNERSLWWYEYSHSFQSRGIYSISMLLFLLLVFLEAPSSNTYITRDALVSPAITVSIECILIAIVWVDIYAQVRYQDTEWRRQLCRRTWLRGRGIVASIITIDLICVVLPFPNIVRFSRPFRVWLLLSRLRNLRNAISMAFRTLPNVALIGGFLMFLVLLFSIVGWLIFDPQNGPWNRIAFNQTHSGLCSTFSPVCNGYFDTYPNTLYQMYILLSGINYPDIALPYLEANYMSSLFFVAYLTLGQIFLMRLLITAAYGAYREELFKRIQHRENRTQLAFSACFDVLTNIGHDGIELHQWLRLVQEVRPKFRIEVARAIFVAAEGDTEEQEARTDQNDSSRGGEVEMVNTSEEDNQEEEGEKKSGVYGVYDSSGAEDANEETKKTIAKNEKLNVETLPVAAKHDATTTTPTVPIVTSYERFVEMLHMLDIQTGKRSITKERWSKPGCINSVRRCSWFTYKKRWVRRSFDLLALFSVARLILVRTGAAPDFGRCVADPNGVGCAYDMIGYAVMSLFCIEQIMKIAALGWYEYWFSWLNRLDFFVSGISISATIIVDIISPLNHENIFLTLAQILPIVRLLRVVGQVVRLVRLVRFSVKAKRMLALVTHVVPNAMRLLAIIASALYFYSVVGMESFAGCLSNRTLVKGSSYDVQKMYPLNFDSFSESLMTSFTMLLVRKYPVLLEGTIACYGPMGWPMVYYFSFYIIVVCFLLNVFVAFILAVFNEVESVQRLDDEYNRQQMIEQRELRHLTQEHHPHNDGNDEDRRRRGSSFARRNNERTRTVSALYRTVSGEKNESVFTSEDTNARDSFVQQHAAVTPRNSARTTPRERSYSGYNAHHSNTDGLHRSRGSVYLRGKVQDLLLRNEDPYRHKNSTSQGNSTNNVSKDLSTSSLDMIHNMFNEKATVENDTPSRIILKSSGPRARDVEKLMLKRHKASNSGSSQGSFMSVDDMIHNKFESDVNKRQDTIKQLHAIAAALGVSVHSITVSENGGGASGGGSSPSNGGGRRGRRGRRDGRSGGGGSGGNLSSRSVGFARQSGDRGLKSSRSIM